MIPELAPRGYLLTHLRLDIKNNVDYSGLIAELFPGSQDEARPSQDVSRYFEQWGAFDALVVSKGRGFPRTTIEHFADCIAQAKASVPPRSHRQRGEGARKGSDVRSYTHSFLFRLKGLRDEDPCSVDIAEFPLVCSTSLAVSHALVDRFGFGALHAAMQAIAHTLRHPTKRKRDKEEDKLVFSILGDLGSSDVHLLIFAKSIEAACGALSQRVRTLTWGDTNLRIDGSSPVRGASLKNTPLLELSYSRICYRSDIILDQRNVRRFIASQPFDQIGRAHV